MAGRVSPPGSSVVSRALAVLYAFDEEHRQLSLTQLAERSGLPLATTFRLARELAAGDALVRLPSGRYSVGRRLWDVGLLAPVQTGLRQVALPFLADVHATTRATVHLAIREGSHALYLERLSGRTSVPVVSRVGGRLPLHATGVGKLLLAHAPADIQDRVLRHLPRLTPYTVTDPGVLRAQLARIVQDGYATTAEEMTLGACSIAVPVRVADEVVAAVAVVVPTLKRDRTRMLTALQVAARSIARSL